MKSAILYHLYSGDVWFTALMIAVLAIGIELWRVERYGAMRRVARTCFLLSLPLAGLAGVPVSWWIAILGVTSWLAVLVLEFGRGREVAGRWAASAFVIIAFSGMVVELIWRWPHTERPEPPRTIVVLGDSLSAGGFEETATWVSRLRDQYRLDVIDLSRASATSASALEFQLPDVPRQCEGDCVVIIELGGNDMLDGKNPKEYEENMSTLISEVRVKGDREIWLIEFPVIPGKWSWAAAQRHLAERFDATLVPKRVLAAALLGPGSTVDGLHLSDAGHERLAEEMARFLGAAR